MDSIESTNGPIQPIGSNEVPSGTNGGSIEEEGQFIRGSTSSPDLVGGESSFEGEGGNQMNEV